MPRRTPAHPQHRVELAQRLDPRVTSRQRQRPAPRPGRAAPRAPEGRNSCSGGSNRRMQTGRPAMISNSAAKSARCIGSRRSSTARPVLGPLGEDHLAHHGQMRSPSKNMCSVRQRPIPSAAKVRAIARLGRRVGVGAHAEVAELVGPAEQRAERPVERRLQQVGPSRQHLARACRRAVITSPSRNTRLARRSACRRAGSIRTPEAPTTQGRPRPRAITAAWLVMPPRSVRTPDGGVHPAHVLGRRLAPDEDAGLAARSRRLRRRRRRRPAARPPRRGSPRCLARPRRAAPAGSVCRCSSSDSSRGATRSTASSRGITPSSASATAIRTAARLDRCTRTASRMQSRPFVQRELDLHLLAQPRRGRSRRARISSAKASGARSSRLGPRSSRVRYSDLPRPAPRAPGSARSQRPMICGRPDLALDELDHARAADRPARRPAPCAGRRGPGPRPPARPRACRSSRAEVPSQARAMLRSTSASWRAGSCGNGSSVSSS